MLTFLKQRFVWQFAGGFLLGAAGMIALQPSATATPQAAPVAYSAR